VKNGTIYVGVDTGIETGVETGIVLALDAETGAREWVHDIEGLPADTTIEGDSESHAEARRQGKPSGAVAVTDERVYVPSWDLSLHALNAETGEREWQFSPGNDNMDRLQAPTVVDGNVYLQNVRAILYVLDAETGELRWTYDEYGDASDGISPIVDDDSVYIIAGTSTENLRLVALERDGGSVRWEHPVGPPFQDPVADANSVYIDQGRNLKAIEKETGDHKWTLKTDRALAAPASVADEAIFIADQSHFYGIW
jgi:outer membrane protein assembly factor BamB